MNKMETIKIALYDILEQQAILHAQLQQLDKLKNDKLQELQDERKAQAAEDRAKASS